MTYPVKSLRKLIEVALPLDAINVACVRENYIYKGNPSAIHKWWAQRPLAAARAVIFAQLVNDPGFQQGGGFKYGKNKKEAAIERKRLFQIIEDLVRWENNNNEDVLESARAEIRRSWRELCTLNKDHPDARELFQPDHLPTLYDAFAGGGSIPLEAQRLGLEARASDLNPIAVLINRAIIEIPGRFKGKLPVGPEAGEASQIEGMALSSGAERLSGGIAEDVRRYGRWMREQTLSRIGHLYPPVIVTEEIVSERTELQELLGRPLNVIAWLWARTVRSPNPAFADVEVPLATTFNISTKVGKEMHVAPVVEGRSYRFTVATGPAPTAIQNGTKASGRGSNFRCIMSDVPISGDYIKAEGQAGRMGTRLMAVVAESRRGRIYLPASSEMETVAELAQPSWKPEGEVPAKLSGGTCVPYGLTRWGDLFTKRQLTGLTTLTDMLAEVRKQVRDDAVVAGMSDDAAGLDSGGSGAAAYAEAICTYLAFAISKTAEYSSSLTVWYPKEDRPKGLFARQAIPMVWDFPEQNILGDIGGSFIKSVQIVADSLQDIRSDTVGSVVQADAASGAVPTSKMLVSTDPPYYNNIAYADLSDFFYVWLRKSLRDVFPSLFGTMSVPKAEELVASPYRHGGNEQAEDFFMRGMTHAMGNLAAASHPALPLTIYYAFKQSESASKTGDVSSAGWATFLEAVIGSGFQLTGTWPMRTERQSRSVGISTNSLASSVVLVCRRRPTDATTISRREFIRELNATLPEALDEMTRGLEGDSSPVAPVDLSQAIIGPGMAVFSRYSAVLEADGTRMGVRSALQIINRFLAEDDFDADTQFCIRWFEQNGWKAGKFGDADTLSRAKGTTVDGVRVAGVVESGGGAVRLKPWSEYPSDWDPRVDTRKPVWETLHHLIRALRLHGESGAGGVLALVREHGESARQLAYRLYTLCERKAWAEDARVYNEVITSWSGIETAAGAMSTEPIQGKLFD